MKSRHGKSQRREEKKREEKRREEKRRRKKIKEDEVSEERRSRARKGRKVAKHCVFLMGCGSGGSQSSAAKAAGAEPSDQMRDAKLHAVVAQGTFPSQNVEKTPCAKQVSKSKVSKTDGLRALWKLGCRKGARRCGTK